MRGDFTRLTFDPRRHYTGVLHQQGRVWLDADWNEDVLNRLNLLQLETEDIVGVCGAPIDGECNASEASTAFRIEPDPAGKLDDFVITGGPGRQGHYYVHGILCQLDEPASYLHQPDYPAPPPLSLPTQGNTSYGLVYLEVWRRLITYLEDETLRETALSGPDTAVRLKTIAQVKVRPLPAGAGDFDCADAAPYLPQSGQGTLTTLQSTPPQPPDLCRIPDPQTYTGRTNQLYRVEIHHGGDVQGEAAGSAFRLALGADAAQGATSLTLATPLDTAQTDAALRAGVVTLQDDQGQTETVPLTSVSGTTLSLGAGLSAAYTVAEHALVIGGVARFKWSRDNGAFAVSIIGVDSADLKTLTLSSLGRDQVTLLRAGDLVEIADDASELGPARGHLTYLSADPDPDLLTVTLADPLPTEFMQPGSPPTVRLDRHPILRRWDGVGWANSTFNAISTPDMNLGDGVHIQFGGEQLQPGDYWLFTARSIDGSVEALTDAPPAGTTRYRCPLAIVRWAWVADNNNESHLTFTVLRDCRSFFPMLTNLTGLFYVSGDGQEVMPNFSQPGQFLPLQERLCVGVANGGCPVANAQVEFQVTKGDGRLENGQSRCVVATDAKGIACCAWELRWDRNPPAPNPTPLTQQVTARLLGDGGSTVHLPVVFTANLSRADQVAYNPANCSDLAGVKTVQEALDVLCKRKGGGCEITVGEGGHFATIEEAMKALREAKAKVWCLCLLPGEHRLANVPELSSETHVSIGACSRGAILILEQTIQATGLESFKLANLTVFDNTTQGLVFKDCRDVTIEDVTILAEQQQGDGMILCGGCESLTMRGDTLIGNDRRTLVLCESTEKVTIHQCRLVGQRNVPIGTLIGKAQRIILTENRLIAPSVPTDGPNRVFVDIPELAALFKITDHEEFMREGRRIAEDLASRSLEERRRISDSIQERVKILRDEGALPRRDLQLYQALARAIELESPDRILHLLSALRNLSAALVLQDGEANTTLHANVITGLVSLYGPPGSLEIEDSDKLLEQLKTRISRRVLEPFTADGGFQGNGNRFTRLVLGQEMIEWIRAIQTSDPDNNNNVPELRVKIYRTCLLTDNVFDIGNNYFMAERISLTSTQFKTGDERSGTSIGLAATFISNAHYRSTSEFAFINVCPIRIETPDLNLMEIDHI